MTDDRTLNLATPQVCCGGVCAAPQLRTTDTDAVPEDAQRAIYYLRVDGAPMDDPLVEIEIDAPFDGPLHDRDGVVRVRYGSRALNHAVLQAMADAMLAAVLEAHPTAPMTASRRYSGTVTPAGATWPAPSESA
ncbi:hypothetical protein [Streptomyces sp. NBRC 109706]|uniref:hypothetical protein n=1 Tax=Streptomyces sp. NBRC 109706 TaxID=1550035 RepID=UPI000784ADFC|nr:hypothetical protein [Streptomyces sp. NBRC 109706]